MKRLPTMANPIPRQDNSSPIRGSTAHSGRGATIYGAPVLFLVGAVVIFAPRPPRHSMTLVV